MVGIIVNEIDEVISYSLWLFYFIICVSIFVGVIGVVIVVCMVKNIMYGFEFYEIVIFFEEWSVMLELMKEGIFVVDEYGKIKFVNVEVKCLFVKMGININFVD